MENKPANDKSASGLLSSCCTFLGSTKPLNADAEGLDDLYYCGSTGLLFRIGPDHKGEQETYRVAKHDMLMLDPIWGLAVQLAKERKFI